MKPKKCEWVECGKDFYSKEKKQRFCSIKCGAFKHPRINRECIRNGCSNIIPKNKDPRQKFCSRTCINLDRTFESRNLTPRKNLEAVKCIDCGDTRSYTPRERCHICKQEKWFKDMMNSPMSKYFGKGNARIKYDRIRKYAIKTLEKQGIEKKCNVCGWDFYVECCHIKGISEFPEDALMKEVNGLNNLTFLCPNHHKMLDKGVLSPKEVHHGSFV